MLKHVNPRIKPSLDPNFKPMALVNRAFAKAVDKSGEEVPLKIALEKGNGLISTYETKVFSDLSSHAKDNNLYIERLVKTLLWIRGGWKLTIAGPRGVCEYIKKTYSTNGLRKFDVDFMSRVYEKPFTVEITDIANIPAAKEKSEPIGRNFNGCRIGFDAGGSDRKVSAVIDGEAVYSEEVVWHPKVTKDPKYHHNEILTAMKSAAAHMPRVDAIGVSSAGIYVNNRTMVASLFIEVPPELFEHQVKNIYLDIAKEMGNAPIAVANDGDVTALTGAMELDDTNVLGIAMGTSEAGGYVDSDGNITGWLNELAFAPVDLNPDAMIDEWSGDYGCGVKYFSQDGVIKLAPAAGIKLNGNLTPAEKLKVVQELHEQGDKRAEQIFYTIGVYLGYTLAYYADFYDIKHVLILGRVTAGKGGNLILTTAENVLAKEFPNLANKMQLHLPDEDNRKVGQSIAAASLPEVKN